MNLDKYGVFFQPTGFVPAEQTDRQTSSPIILLTSDKALPVAMVMMSLCQQSCALDRNMIFFLMFSQLPGSIILSSPSLSSSSSIFFFLPSFLLLLSLLLLCFSPSPLSLLLPLPSLLPPPSSSLFSPAMSVT